MVLARTEARVELTERPNAAATVSAWYEEHAAGVYRFALHLAGTREDAEDVVQFCFLQAHRALGAGAEIANPRAWLMTTAKRRWLTVVRDRHDVPFDPSVLAETAGEFDAGRAGAELASVRASLWTLPAAQHEAFVLRHWSGLSQGEIAEVLETTPTAVESLLARARAALLADRGASDRCRTVRERLATGSSRSGDDEHVRSCRRCRVAKARLSQAMSIATVLSLAPHQHVADALASTIPGFGGAGVTAGAGSTVAASGAGSSIAATGGGIQSSGMLASGAGKLLAIAKAATVAGAVVTAATAATVTHPAFFHDTARLLERPVQALVGAGHSGASAHGSAGGRQHDPAGGGRSNALGHGGKAVGPSAPSTATHGKGAEPAHGHPATGRGGGTTSAAGSRGRSAGQGNPNPAGGSSSGSQGASGSASHGTPSGASGGPGGSSTGGSGNGRSGGSGSAGGHRGGGSAGGGNGTDGGSNGKAPGAGGGAGKSGS